MQCNFFKLIFLKTLWRQCKFNHELMRLHLRPHRGKKINICHKVTKLSFCNSRFVTKKVFRHWEGLCDKETSQTVQILWCVIYFIQSFRFLVNSFKFQLVSVASLKRVYFKVNINLKWFLRMSKLKKLYDQCSQQNNTMLLHDNVFINSCSSCYKMNPEKLPRINTNLLLLLWATFADSMMFGCFAGNSSIEVVINQTSNRIVKIKPWFIFNYYITLHYTFASWQKDHTYLESWIRQKRRSFICLILQFCLLCLLWVRQLKWIRLLSYQSEFSDLKENWTFAEINNSMPELAAFMSVLVKKTRPF